MRRSLLWIAALASTVVTVHAQDIVGDWQGLISAGGRQVHLIVHIIRDKGGALQGTLDSVEQGVMGLPLSVVAFQDSKLTFRMDAANIRYEGIVNAAGTEIPGTWTQGQTAPLDFKRMAAAVKPPAAAAKPSAIDGVWLGLMDVGGLRMRFAFHIANTESGLTATFDSLDQKVTGIPASSVTADGTAVKIELKTAAGAYEGKISADRGTIDGTLTLRGVARPLVLHRVKDLAELELRRPQEPVRPFPYREEDVVYENQSAGIKLAATFTIPQGKGPFPAVVLMAGSGAHDRDEFMLGHKPFLLLADYLTRKGIAVLRYDDRGVAKSGGNFATATSADFATDAEAGVAWLKTRPEVNPHKIGLIGHSEGGSIAPMVAARNRDVAFIVMLAGSGMRGDETVVAQVMAGNEAEGASPDQVLKIGDHERQTLAAVEAEKDAGKLRAKLAALLPAEQVDEAVATMNSAWYRFFLVYDPSVELRKVACPVLALIGEKDTQAPPKQNLPAIRRALEEGGNQQFEVVEMPGLNHLFQHAKTGALSEYGTIEETMSPEALEKIASWVLAR
ncbi:MAG: alpha/beta fold hydrolase [Bryobacteraceae bacterium]|jgi:fermentation-respiration switch protein FrsA (DUF1100 family)